MDEALNLRRTCYLLIGTLAIGIMVGRIVGAENVVEPSRYAPLPKEGSFGANRADKPIRVWPKERPEPSPFYGSNDRSRWATVHAIVDGGTFVIGKRDDHANPKPTPGRMDFQDRDKGIIFENEYQSLDKVMNPETGEYFSSKPPFFTVVVAGEYWLLKNTIGWDFTHDRWPVVCTILITVNVLPFLVFLILLTKLVEQFGRTSFGKLFVFSLASVGTFLTTFSITLNNHGPAAYCVLFALYPLLRSTSPSPGSLREPPSPTRGEGEDKLPSPLVGEGSGVRASGGDLLLSGFFAGLAAVLELPALAFTVALFVPLLYTRPLRTLVYFVPAMLLPIVAQFACNYWAMGRLLPAYSDFGGPWYNFPGSHWAKLEKAQAGEWQRGIDFANEPKHVYAFHLLFGHHGWFSLTPAFLLALGGLLTLVWQSREQVLNVLKRKGSASAVFTFPVVGTMTLVISAVVLGFYIVKTNNYAGNTSGPRWLFWLIPLWLLGLLPAADWIGRKRVGCLVAAILLGFSVMSVFYPAWNPWRSPWIQQLGERADWFNYEVKP